MAGLLVAKLFGADDSTQFFTATVGGLVALLPDIDSPDSFIGHITGPVAWALNGLFGHRHLTHSLLAVFLVFLAGKWLFHLSTPYLAAVVAGYASHLVLDALNPQGVPLFYPHPKRFSIPLVATGTVPDRLLGLGLFVLLFFVCANARVS